MKGSRIGRVCTPHDDATPWDDTLPGQRLPPGGAFALGGLNLREVVLSCLDEGVWRTSASMRRELDEHARMTGSRKIEGIQIQYTLRHLGDDGVAVSRPIAKDADGCTMEWALADEEAAATGGGHIGSEGSTA